MLILNQSPLMEGGNTTTTEYRKGLWTVEEDRILIDYIKVHGKGKWNRVARVTGLKRCGKSCRLRWMNYLSPGVKRDNFSEEEDDLIIRLHKLLGNRWSLIAGRVPGRTDNQVKNYWNTHLSKRLGVKNGKCKASAPSPGFSTKELREDFNASSSAETATNPACTNGVVTDHDAMEDGSKSTAMELTSNQQRMPADEWDSNPFLFLNDIDPNLYAPQFMEFLDESLDFVWHHF